MSNAGIPLITIHKGNPFYLKNALHHASYYNHDSDIILLGDAANKALERGNIHHHLIEDYMESANVFASKYKHMSMNQYDYELFCFQRWFIIQCYVKAHNLQEFFVFDSDVLLYCNVTSELKNFHNYDFILCNNRILSSTLMNQNSLNKFADFILQRYSDPIAFNELEIIYKSCFDEKGQLLKIEGVNDLTMVDLYLKHFSLRVLDLGIPVNGVFFDSKINSSDNFALDHRGLKKTIWINNLPYGIYGESKEKMRFCSMHFQGRSKMWQHKYLIDNKGCHLDPVPLSIRWIVFKAWIKKIINGLRKFRFYYKWLLTRFRIKLKNQKKPK